MLGRSHIYHNLGWCDFWIYAWAWPDLPSLWRHDSSERITYLITLRKINLRSINLKILKITIKMFVTEILLWWWNTKGERKICQKNEKSVKVMKILKREFVRKSVGGTDWDIYVCIIIWQYWCVGPISRIGCVCCYTALICMLQAAWADRGSEKKNSDENLAGNINFY